MAATESRRASLLRRAEFVAAILFALAVAGLAVTVALQQSHRPAAPAAPAGIERTGTPGPGGCDGTTVTGKPKPLCPPP